METLNADLLPLRDVFNLPDCDGNIRDHLKQREENEAKLHRPIVAKGFPWGQPVGKLQSRTKRSLHNTRDTVKMNKSGDRCPSYEQLFSQLSDFERDLIYTAYYNDFELFGYEPL